MYHVTMLTAAWTYHMVGQDSLWETAHRVHDRLMAAAIPHAIVGGVAVCLHGYRRTTVDVDLLIRPGDTESIRTLLTESEFVWSEGDREFRSPSGVPIHFVLTGDSQGPRQPSRFPDPADPTILDEREGLPVLTLAALIQAKIACGLGNLRRTHKDFADVVELIAIHTLKGGFARYLHPSVRPEFRTLVKRASA